MKTNDTGYWQRLWQALLGRPETPAPAPPAPAAPAPATPAPTAPSADVAALRGRIATLEMDVRQRDEHIEQMKREYAALQVERDRTASGAGRQELEKLLRKLCGPLSNLVTLAAGARGGQSVAATDMAELVEDLEQRLGEAGLQTIGRAGEETPFDVAAHQRMSGGAVHSGGAVTVRIPGYRLGVKVLQKAMVTAKE